MAEGIFKTDFGDVYSKDGVVYLQSKAGIKKVLPEDAVGYLRTGIYQPATVEAAQAEDVRIARSSLSEQAKTAAEGFLSGAYDVATAPATLPLKAGAALLGQPDPTAEISGRRVLSNIAGFGGPAAQQQYEEAARQRATINPGLETGFNLAGSAAGGIGIGGLVRSGAALGTEALGGGLAARIGTAAVTSGFEGAAYSAAQASEDSFIENRELTSEQLLAQLGAGAFIGGLVGLGSEGAIEGVKFGGRKLRQKASEVVRGFKGEIPAKDQALDQALQSGALKGEQPASNLASAWRDLSEAANKNLSAVQSAASGADREALQKFSPLNPKNWERSETNPYDLYHNRDKILEGATQSVTEQVQTLLEKSREVGNEVWEVPAKLEQVRGNLEALSPDAQVAAQKAAQEQLAGMRASLRELEGGPVEVDKLATTGLENMNYLRDGMRDLKAFREAYQTPGTPVPSWKEFTTGKMGPYMKEEGSHAAAMERLSREYKALKEGAASSKVSPEEAQQIALGERLPLNSSKPFEPVRVHVDADGTMHLNDGRHRMTAAKEAGAKELRAIVTHYDEVGNPISEEIRNLPISAQKAPKAIVDPFLADLDSWTAGLEKEAAAGPSEAYSAVDQAKRALQKKVDRVGRTLRAQTNPLELERLETLTSHLNDQQESLRTFLEDQGVWGKQGLAQQEANAGTKRWLRYKSFFENSFATKTGRDYGGIGGRPIFEADRNKIGSYLQNLGKREGSLQDKAFREFVDSTLDFTDAIGRNYGVSEEATRGVAAIKQAAAEIRSSLKKADVTVKTANQLDEIVKADASSSLLGDIGFGSLLGGPVGAVAGAALGFATRPGRLIRQAAAIKQLTNRFDAEVGAALKGFFERSVGKLKPIGESVKATGRGLKTASIGSLAAFQGQHPNLNSAYHARVEEVIRANADHGAAIREHSRDSLGDLHELTPKLAQSMVGKATNAAGYLQSKIPTGLVSPTAFQPSRKAAPSSADIAEFAKIWAAVNSPLTALKDLEQGRLTFSQVDALQNVYPALYQKLQINALDWIRQADLEGKQLPYRDKLQLDILLNLQGAGDPTMTPDFALRIDSIRQAKQSQHAGATPPAQAMSARTAETTKTTIQRLESEK